MDDDNPYLPSSSRSEIGTAVRWHKLTAVTLAIVFIFLVGPVAARISMDIVTPAVWLVDANLKVYFGRGVAAIAGQALPTFLGGYILGRVVNRIKRAIYVLLVIVLCQHCIGLCVQLFSFRDVAIPFVVVAVSGHFAFFAVFLLSGIWKGRVDRLAVG
jgi:hypothetical protein